MRIVPVILLVASRPCSGQQYDYGISEDTGMPDYGQFFPVPKNPNDRFGLPALPAIPDCVMTCGTGSTCAKPNCVCDSGYVLDESLTTLKTFVCKGMLHEIRDLMIVLSYTCWLFFVWITSLFITWIKLCYYLTSTLKRTVTWHDCWKGLVLDILRLLLVGHQYKICFRFLKVHYNNK